MSTMIPDDVATMAGGPEPIGPPGAPPMGPPGPPMGPAGPMGAPPPDAGGMPPELLAALAGGGAPGGEEMQEPPGPEEPESEVDQLQTIVDGIMQYLQIASDDIEKSTAAKGLNIFQSLLASNQKEQEAAAGVGPAQRGMAKALAGP